MINSFKEWIDKNKVKLEIKGIQTEEIYITPDIYPEKGGYVDHTTDLYIGRVSIRDEGYVDIEIFEIATEIRVMIAHYENQKKFYPDLILSYLRILEALD